MSKDGVFLALGKPENVSYGANKSGEYEQWNYYSLRPVVRHSFGGYYGWNRGYSYNRRGGLGYSPNIAYLPKKSGIVRFSGDRVDEYKSAGKSLY